MKSGRLASCVFLVLAFTMTGAPRAQEQAGELEQVVVTAQKREQDLQKVPSSVAAVSDEKLDVMTSGGLDVRLLSARVPSLYVESSFGRTFPRFYIRGLGNTDFDLNASQPVSLVYDEVVLENPILKGFPIFDMDRIEVLRGPQGTLFGRNTPAGIVKFESRKPTHETGGYGRLSYGRYDSFQFEGALNAPLAEDVLAGRVSALYQGRSDWVVNTFSPQSRRLGGYDEYAVRAQLLFTPNEQFSALLNGHARELNGTARLFQSNLVDVGSDEIVADFKRDEIGIDGANQQKLQTRGAVANLRLDLDKATITSVTGYENGELFSRGDIDGGFGASFSTPAGPRAPVPFPSETADGIPSLHQFTEEIRLASNAWDRGFFQGGFFYFFENLDVESFSYDTLADGVQNGFAWQRQEARAWAVFGAAEVNVTDELTASGGVRYSDNQKDFSAQRTQSPLAFFGVPDSTNVITEDLSADFVSWDGSLSYALRLDPIDTDVNVYGRVARSFRAPSVQGRLLFGDPAVFDSTSTGNTEKIISYEGGFKTSFGSRARANISGFYYEMDDQQLTAVGGAGNFNRLLNADKSTGMGFELDLEFLPVNQIFITAGASYNKTEIEDENLGTQPPTPPADPLPSVLDPLLNPADTLSTVVSIHKNSFPNAPEWVLNGTLRAATPVGSDGEAFFYTDWAYRSEINFFLYESLEFRDRHLVEGGVRVGYSRYDRSYEVAVFGRNITNNLSRTGGIDFNNLTGFVNEPATWGVEVRRAF